METLRERRRTRLSVAGQQTQDARGTDAGTLMHTMVLQAAVTPGRSRRLLLKLPVGTLRRNSEDRVRRREGLPVRLAQGYDGLCAAVEAFVC